MRRWTTFKNHSPAPGASSTASAINILASLTNPTPLHRRAGRASLESSRRPPRRAGSDLAGRAAETAEESACPEAPAA
jgi:hypothetical protein